VQLHALLGREHRGLGAVRLGQGGRDRRVVGTDARGGVARHRAGLCDARPQVGEAVLQRLERADRATELVPVLQVVDGGVEAPLRQPHLFGGEQRGARRERGGHRTHGRFPLGKRLPGRT
jgi:hypothetical protein